MIGKIKVLISGLLFLTSFAMAANWMGLSSKPKTKVIEGKVFYEITSAEELTWFAEQVNDSKVAINAILANDIQFMNDTNKTSSVNWTPIGKDTTVKFNGIFDGDDHTIYGLYCKQEKYAGIFGVTDRGALVKNVSSKASSIKTTKIWNMTGGIVAYNNGVVSNCTNTGEVTSISRGFIIGGIVGGNVGMILDCINQGDVYSDFGVQNVEGGAGGNIGGIVGGNSGIISGCVNDHKIMGKNISSSNLRLLRVGGIAGGSNGKILECVNNDSIVVFGGRMHLGGIVGSNGDSILNCINKGRLVAIAQPQSVFSGFWVDRDMRVGGCVADNGGAVLNCTNDNEVANLISYSVPDSVIWQGFVSFYLGGVVASNDSGGIVLNSVNRGKIKSEIFTNALIFHYSGGVVGYNSGSISNCINKDSVAVSVALTVDPSGPQQKDWRNFFSGGIAGDDVSDRDSGVILKSVNMGHVVVDFTTKDSVSSVFLGGIAGRGKPSRCINEGTVSVSSESKRFSTSGGIVGMGEPSDCINKGNVYGEGYLGGIVGWTKEKPRNSYSVGTHANYGVVEFDSSGLVANCFYDSDVLPGKSIEYPNVGMTTVSMQNDQFAWSLNTTNGKDTNSGIWSRDSIGYPIFADSIYKPIYKVTFNDDSVNIERYTNFKGRAVFPDDPKTSDGKMFTGWYSNGYKIQASTIFTKDLIVYANYVDTSEIFTIHFFDGDSSFLEKQTVKYGEIPVYHGSTPTKKSTGKYSYTFAGWHTEIVAATEDFAYYAVFDSIGSENPAALIANLPTPTWNVTISGRNFQIHSAPVGKSYALFDLQGKVLAKGRVESSEMTVSAPRAGSYIIRVGERSVRMNAR